MLDIVDEKMTSSTNIQVNEVAKLVAIVEHMMRARCRVATRVRGEQGGTTGALD